MPTPASKDNYVHGWTTFIIGVCAGVLCTVILLSFAIGASHASYVASAWTVFIVAAVVGALEILRIANYPSD